MNNFLELMKAGVQLFQAGRFPEAAANFRDALKLQPSHADAHQLLGLSLVRGGEVGEGERLIREAIRLSPSNPGMRNNLASILKELGRLDEAAAEFRALTEMAPNEPKYTSNLAIVLLDLKESHEALSYADRAVELAPNWGQAHHIQGLILDELNDISAAEQSLRRAVALEPNNPEFNSNLSAVLVTLEKYAEAERHARTALALQPNRSDALRNLALALARQRKLEEAAQTFERQVRLDPDNAQSIADWATVTSELGECARAAELYRQASEFQPDYGLARFGLSLMQLTMGDFKQGWRNYEARQSTPELKIAPRPACAAAWRGEPLAGKHLLLYAEQGYGDILQFVRFVPHLLNMGARITIEAPFQIVGLLRQSRWIVDYVSATESLSQSYDFECSLLSVPMVLDIGFDDLPGGYTYLHSDPAKTAVWRSRLPTTERMRIGLCWAGQRTHKNDHNRSIPVDVFRELCADVDASFISLQKEGGTEGVECFARHGIPLFDPTAELTNFEDTAALIDTLDHVVTVDTVIAHLAGGLGKPVWTLIPFVPDWRWLVGREDSPWYPSMRLFRQTRRGDWHETMEQVRRALATLIQGK